MTCLGFVVLVSVVSFVIWVTLYMGGPDDE